jgi:hypothetical protein
MPTAEHEIEPWRLDIVAARSAWATDSDCREAYSDGYSLGHFEGSAPLRTARRLLRAVFLLGVVVGVAGMALLVAAVW